MKASEIKVGGKYVARVSGVLTTVCVDAVRERQGFKRTETVYDVTNLTTGRKTTFRSAAKFRLPAGPTLVQRKRLESALGNLAGQAVRGAITPEQHDVEHATILKEEADRRDDEDEEDKQRPDPTPESTCDALPDTASSLAPSNPPTLPSNEIAPVSRTTGAGVTTAEHSASSRAFASEAVYDEPVPDGLAGDQPDAFRRVTTRVLDGARYTKLVGYAGTGKTYLLGHIARWAQGRGYKVTVAAPTHKAAGVIKEKLAQFGAAGIEVRTIHSLLGLRLEVDYEQDTGGRILQARLDAEPPRGLVICDEASMVGSELKAHIDRLPGVQWVFVGDLAQLPPVGESVSELLDDPDASLERVLRQATGSEILNVATAVRNGDQSMAFERGRDVDQVDSAEELFAAAHKRFDSDAYRTDAAHARMLVFKNARREAINSRMRSLLVDSPDPYTVSEWLVMYAQFCPTKSRLNVMAETAKRHAKGTPAAKRAWRSFFNLKESKEGANPAVLHVSQEVRVAGVDTGVVEVVPWAFDVWRLKVGTQDGKEYELPVLTAAELARMEKIKGEVREEALAQRARQDAARPGTHEYLDAEAQRKQAWSAFFALDETFARVDYAYAMTVHKSQGSTFDHAFVDVPDLLTAGGMTQRILYTAVTRPAKSLTFYV